MKFLTAAAIAFLGATLVAAQEQARVPKDSERIAIPGCARDRVFIVAESPSHEPVGTRLEPGRRFRLAGKRELLDDIRRREGTMVEITGLVRKSDLEGPSGVRLFGGRVRIGGAQPQAPLSDTRRSSGYTEAVLDLESFRPLPEPCPSR